jgi:hypothetical protein
MAGPWIIEWFRPDRRRAIIKVSVAAGVTTMLGAISIGVSRMLPVPETVATVLAVVGMIFTVGGPVSAIVGFGRVLGGDVYLAIRGDGVAYNGPDGMTVVSWDELAEVAHDPDGRLTFRLESGRELTAPERFADLSPDELVKRISRTHQRALMGLLRPPAHDPAGRAWQST